ncbi:MAG: DUF1801 domain-containing protein [Burkholderiaceae bacterium]
MAQTATSEDEPAAQRIDEQIARLGGWRGDTLRAVPHLIRAADPDIVEKCKWATPSNPAGVPVWSHAGIVCTGESYAAKIKLTFARGAALPDPAGLFNASLDGNTRRAIDLHEGDRIDEAAFQALVRDAVALNVAAAQGSRKCSR